MEQLRAYGETTRAVGPSLLLVLPLLLAHEAALIWLDPPVRNSAALAVSDLLSRLPTHALDALRLGLLAALIVIAVVGLRKRPFTPVLARWVFVEALALAILLGPLVGRMVGGFGLSASSRPEVPADLPWLPVLLSVGAGLWEELVFRLGLLGGTAFLLVRLVTWNQLAALTVATLLSALVFALYHHVGPSGEAMVADRFAFRWVAGILLGVVFVWRGLAVVVYMHVFYDLLCDARMALA